MDNETFLKTIIFLIPGFQAHWDDPDNYYLSDRGSFNAHNVCTALAHFYIDHSQTLTNDIQQRLFAFLESELISTAPNNDANDTTTAISHSFLEAIALTESAIRAIPFMGIETTLIYQRVKDTM